MRRFLTMKCGIMILALLLCSSCTAITHVDDFEAMDPEIEQCMEQEFNLNLSDECTYCRCTNCDVEIRECGLRCWEIVTCALVNRCDQGNISDCVSKNCGGVLDRAQGGIDQASALAVCISRCNDVCLTR